MAFDRAATLTELNSRYSLLLSQAGIAATDTADGLKPPLDDTARIATANPALAQATLTALARYLTLDRIVERLAAQFDVTTKGDSYKLNQLYTNAKALRDSLEQTVGWLALADTAAAPPIVTVTAPYLSGGVATGDEFGALR